MYCGVAALAATVAPMPAAIAQTQYDPYKWCAVYSGDRGGGTNCGFITYQQCLDTISGAGGYCAPNPFYTGDRKAVRQRSRR
jgi:hypothetical protein